MLKSVTTEEQLFKLLCFAFGIGIVEKYVALDAASMTWYEESGASRTGRLALVALRNAMSKNILRNIYST